MQNLLQKLREKPEAVRERIALVTTIFLTLIIVGVWLNTNQVFTFSPTSDDTVTAVLVDELSPVDALKKSFSQFSDNFSKNVEDLTAKFTTQSELDGVVATTTEEL